MTLVVYALTSRLATRRVALAAAWFTALFPPIPYYGALVLTEVLCTVLRHARHLDRGARRAGSPSDAITS